MTKPLTRAQNERTNALEELAKEPLEFIDTYTTKCRGVTQGETARCLEERGLATKEKLDPEPGERYGTLVYSIREKIRDEQRK